MNQLLSILIFIGILRGCQEEVPCNTFTLGDPIEVYLGETVTDCGKELSLTFVELVSDSRCPANVQCVWQGMVEVKLSINIQGRESTFHLSSEPDHGEKIPNSKVIEGYRIKLENVLPYPVEGTSVKDKERLVILSIQKTEN
jgi:hypothetical protein